jgi:nucleotide-binding universal stress UspA family protein
MYKNIMRALQSYPKPTPDRALEQAVDFAARSKARLTAVAFEAVVPASGSLISDKVLRLSDLIEEERRKSAANARSLFDKVWTLAKASSVIFNSHLRHCTTIEVPRRMAERARLFDLTLIPTGSDEVSRSDAEAIIFESGRPVLLLPSWIFQRLDSRFEKVGIAWDFSRAAARVVGDALPLLRHVSQIRTVIVQGDKPMPKGLTGADFVEHLAQHEISCVMDEVEAGGMSIGQVLTSYVKSHELDMLVMGSYGRPWAMEFLLGGATRSMMINPPCPILMSH